MSKRVLEILSEKFGDDVLETHAQFGDETAVVSSSRWREVAQFLRDDPRLSFDMFTDLAGVDWMGMQEPRFEVVLHLRSLEKGHRIRVKTRVSEDKAELDSLYPVWRGADWLEREAFDMFGITFHGHPDLRRILMYPEFEGYPLRKDFPANGIQPLVEFREGNYEKLEPFREDEGMSFGRQTHDHDLGGEEDWES